MVVVLHDCPSQWGLYLWKDCAKECARESAKDCAKECVKECVKECATESAMDWARDGIVVLDTTAFHVKCLVMDSDEMVC